MRQFKDAGVNTVCIFAANTQNSLAALLQVPARVALVGSMIRLAGQAVRRCARGESEREFICMIDLNTPIWLQHQLALRGSRSATVSPC